MDNSTHYLLFYSLNEDPFRLTPDPRFLYLTKSVRNALGSMLRGVVYRKGLIVVTGAVGVGKTLLLNAFQHILAHLYSAPRQLPTAFLVNPTLTPEEFFETLINEFETGGIASTKLGRLTALNELLLSAQARGSTAVLIVDEAHLLSVEVLEEVRLLTNMETYKEKLLQVILCGQTELSILVQSQKMRALRQRIAVVVHLDGLNEDETSAYVQQRLSAAGLNGRIPFTDSAIGQLHQVTSGIPRLINLVTENALQAGSRLQRPLIGPEIVLEAAAELSLPDVQQLAQGRKFKVNITSAKSYSAQLSSAVRPTS